MSLTLSSFVPRVSRISPVALALVAALFSGSIVGAQAGTTATSTAAGQIAGVVFDSLRGGTVGGAIVQLVEEGAQVVRRESFTKTDGKFAFDSVPAGSYQLRMLHLTLDTLGLAVVSPVFALNETQPLEIDLSIPSAKRLALQLCGVDMLLRGPSLVAGVIRDPETGEPVPGAAVSLDHSTRDVFGLTRTPALRTTKSDAQGRFRICGLPDRVGGTLVAMYEGVSSGEVPIHIDDDIIALRGVSFSLGNRVVTVKVDSAPGKVLRVLVGKGRLSGKVVDDNGQAVEGARVSVLGTLAATTTNAQGVFTLDSLPSGSQSVEIRKLGFGVTERAVEISSAAPDLVTLTMDKMPAMLPATVTVAKTPYEKALDRTGYTERFQKHPGGWFRHGDNLLSHTQYFTDMVRNIPGLKVRTSGDGPDMKQYLEPATGGIQTCVNYFIDGMPYKEHQRGDLDNEIQPDQVQALEYYTTSQIPAEFFGRGGMSNCAVLVIWTTARIPHKPGR